MSSGRQEPAEREKRGRFRAHLRYFGCRSGQDGPQNATRSANGTQKVSWAGRSPVAEHWSPSTGRRALVAEHRSPSTGRRALVAEHWSPSRLVAERRRAAHSAQPLIAQVKSPGLREPHRVCLAVDILAMPI